MYDDDLELTRLYGTINDQLRLLNVLRTLPSRQDENSPFLQGLLMAVEDYPAFYLKHTGEVLIPETYHLQDHNRLRRITTEGLAYDISYNIAHFMTKLTAKMIKNIKSLFNTDMGDSFKRGGEIYLLETVYFNWKAKLKPTIESKEIQGYDYNTTSNIINDLANLKNIILDIFANTTSFNNYKFKNMDLYAKFGKYIYHKNANSPGAMDKKVISGKTYSKSLIDPSASFTVSGLRALIDRIDKDILASRFGLKLTQQITSVTKEVTVQLKDNKDPDYVAHVAEVLETANKIVRLYYDNTLNIVKFITSIKTK